MGIDCKNTEQIQTGSFLERFNSERSCEIKYNHIKYLFFISLENSKYIFFEKNREEN